MFSPASLKTLFLLCVCLAAGRAGAQLASEKPLAPADVAVAASLHAPNSVDLAREYMGGRGIPEANLLVTGMPLKDAVSRQDYDRYIAAPLRDFLAQPGMEHIRCVVLMYGVPVEVLEPAPLPEDKRMQRRLKDEREAAIGEALNLVEQADALAGLSKKEADAKPLLEPKANAIKQLNDLGRRVLDGLSAAQKKADKQSGADQAVSQLKIGMLVKSAFGDDAIGAWERLQHAPPPAAPDRETRMARLRELAVQPLSPESLTEMLPLLGKTRGVFGTINALDGLIARSTPDWTWRASVDSELACLFWPQYPIVKYQGNPLSMRTPPGTKFPRTLMTCRLDGPDAETVRCMMRDSLAVERKGLTGKIYIDARGSRGQNLYVVYDRALLRLAKMLEAHTTASVTVEKTEKLFQAGQCPDAALYCGWYSLAKYVPAFTWRPGAVAWHIASAEAKNLHKPGAANWCPSILANGGAATLGPVDEPYLTTFPMPDEFFGMLVTGRFTLADCYWKTTPAVSWMMTLIGDPLYTPYKNAPLMDLADYLDALQGETEP